MFLVVNGTFVLPCEESPSSTPPPLAKSAGGYARAPSLSATAQDCRDALGIDTDFILAPFKVLVPDPSMSSKFTRNIDSGLADLCADQGPASTS